MKIKLLRDNAKIPQVATEGSACFDLFCCNKDDVEIKPGQTKYFPLGFATEFNKGLVALIFIRSGISSKRNLMLSNGVAVIDSDYRGEWVLSIHNNGIKTQIVEAGERVAQLLLIRKENPVFDVVDELNYSIRGVGGYGSTGK